MKKIVKIMLVLSMLLSVCILSNASESSEIGKVSVIELPECEVGETIRIPVGDAEYITNSKGELIKIEDLVSFSSREEADKFIEELRESFIEDQSERVSSNDTRATHGDALVDEVNASANLCKIQLRVAYSTSGDSNTGVVTYHEAYTTFIGFTNSFEWEETSCHSELTASGKNIYAAATGEFVYYFFIEGFIEMSRTPIHLEGMILAIR